jgi:hypothetical protein
MKQLTKIILFLVVALPFLVTSCIKEDQYPIEPVIDYQGFATLSDLNNHDSLGQITISYTDGDGDIGLYDYDTIEPLKYNFYLKFFSQKNGQPVELIPADPNLGFNARIPILTPTGKNKNIKGEISFDLELYYAWSLLESDTISFEVYIKDRAQHISNIVKTPQYIIHRP